MNCLPIMLPMRNENDQLIKYTFCPSGNCLNIPEIKYSYNLLNTQFQFKCVCQKYNNNTEMNLNEFLFKSSQLNCYSCSRKLLDGQIIYCIECKNIFDVNCLEIHHRAAKHSHYIQLNKNIFNYCLEHKTPLIFRCVDCNKSLCGKCDFSLHDAKGHLLEQLRNKINFNQNDLDKIKSTFEKQKKYFEKIKAFNNNLIQNLENDIQIKERIINNYLTNKSDYNSILNLKNIYISNNEKYENILDEMFKEKDDNCQNHEGENISDFINNYLSTLYYGLMINKEEAINNSLISDLEKKVISFNPQLNNDNNNLMNMNNQMQEENIIYYNSNIENSKNNSNILFNSADINKIYNNYNLTPNEQNNNNFSNLSGLFDDKILDNKNIEEISHISLDQKNSIISGQNLSGHKKQNSNIKFRCFKNINKLKSSKLFNNKLSKNPKIKKRISISNNNFLKNSAISLSNSISSSNKKRFIKSSKRVKSLTNIKLLKKNQKKTKIKAESDISSDSQEINSVDSSKNNGKKERKNINYINNMTLLKSGNVAVSKKEAVEIYNLCQIKFSEGNGYYNNELIQNNCLLQRINLVKNRKISYVYQLDDETLLCATYAKIFRIRLKNHDTAHEIISFIKIETSEIPTKIISLGNEFLVLLTEQKVFCNIKIFKNNNSEPKNFQKQNNSNENKINNENNNSINNLRNKLDPNQMLSNYDDVPAIGNCGLFVGKEIEEDTSFELISKNINEQRKLWVSVHPIEKKLNYKNNSLDKNNDNYLYEFIATSNKTYDYGQDAIVFYGIKKKKKGKCNYTIEKIQEIPNISCSTETDTICQINDKYLCIGLQNHNLKEQLSGFAIIDIYKRSYYRIILEQEISCVYYNAVNNLLFASMEVRDPKGNYFSSKVYKIIFEKGDKGDEEIGFHKLFEFKNNHTDSITSIQQIGFNKTEENINSSNAINEIIFATSSKDSTLELVKFKSSN